MTPSEGTSASCDTALSPEFHFHSHDYLRHNQRRQERLASQQLPLSGRTVLEVAAGTEDHTSFFLDPGCQVVTTEGRLQNLEMLRGRYPKLSVLHLDLDDPQGLVGEAFEVVIAMVRSTILNILRKP